MQGPKVIHVVPALFDSNGDIKGGAERYAYELARHMAERVRTELIAFGTFDDERIVGSLKVRIFGGSWAANGRAHDPFSPRLLSHLRRGNVIHFHQQNIKASKIGAIVARVLGRRPYVTDHGGGAWGLGTRLPGAFLGRLHVSRFSLAVAGEGDRPDAQVIGAGVDLQRFGPKRGAARKRVLFVGRLLPHKGVDDLIEGLPAGVGLDVVGPAMQPSYLDDLHALAEDKDVAFHHEMSDDGVANAYREAMCVVLPSVYRDRYGGTTRVPELLGQTLLEGMASGTAAICTDVGGMPEVVVEGETGFIVPPNNPAELASSINKFAGDRALADRMGARGRAHVERMFSWASVVSRALRAYGETE